MAIDTKYMNDFKMQGHFYSENCNFKFDFDTHPEYIKMIDPLIFGFISIICVVLSMYPIFNNIGDSSDL